MSNAATLEAYAVRLETHLPGVLGEIAEACRVAGRTEESVRVVAVTKGHPVEAIEAARAAGLTRMGENRVGELASKVEQLGREGLEWHMIGHIQRRKVGPLLPIVDLIHSIDSERLAERVDRVAREAGATASVLLQVNVSGEGAKGGLEPPEAVDQALRIAALPGLDVRGLMTMAPFVADEPILRQTFAGLRTLSDTLRRQDPSISGELSMGMSNDLRFAVEEGSTMVRIGTALFGPRPGAATGA